MVNRPLETPLLNNRYRLLDTRGAGGMAVVYRAQDIMLERQVAIKLLRQDYSNNEPFREQFRRDFLTMEKMISQHNRKRSKSTTYPFYPLRLPDTGDTPLEDPLLYAQQLQLSEILENAPTLQSAQASLLQSTLANSDWEIEKWQPHMLETALAIAQKWKNGFG